MAASKPAPRPTSNAKLAQRLDDLEERMKAVESVVDSAKMRQQKAMADKLAQNPEQVAALKAIIDMAEKAKPSA